MFPSQAFGAVRWNDKCRLARWKRLCFWILNLGRVGRCCHSGDHIFLRALRDRVEASKSVFPVPTCRDLLPLLPLDW